MRKLLHKLRYAIDVGVDFLVRNIGDDGTIYGETDLNKHFLATLCISENKVADVKIKLALSKISSVSYKRGKEAFAVSDNSSPVSLNALASLSFMNYNMTNLGLLYLNSIKQKNDGYISPDIMRDVEASDFNYMGQAVKAMIKAFELTKDKKWLDSALLSLDWIVKNGNLDDIWNAVAISDAEKYNQDKSTDTFLDMMAKKNPDNIHICCYKTPYEIEKIKALAYEIMETQNISPNILFCGGFFDENNKAQIDISQKNINTMKVVYNNIECLQT